MKGDTGATGSQGPAGPQGERGTPGAGAGPFVTFNGVSLERYGARGVDSIGRPGPGHYRIDFAEDVSGCAVTAMPESVGAVFATVSARAGDNVEVRVWELSGGAGNVTRMNVIAIC